MDPLNLDPRTIKLGCLVLGGAPLALALLLWLFGAFGGNPLPGEDLDVARRRLANRETRHVLDAILQLGEWSPRRPRTAAELEQALLQAEAAYDQALRAAPRHPPKPTFLQTLYVLPLRRGRAKPTAVSTSDRELAQNRQRLRQLLDPWGRNRYQIRVDLNVGSARLDLPHLGLIHVTSAGADLRFGTPDDIDAFDFPPWTAKPQVTPTADKYFFGATAPPEPTPPAAPATPAGGAPKRGPE